MVDVNLRAIHLTKMNIKENKVNNCNAFVSNVYENIDNTRDYVRANAIPAPLFFFGKNIKPQHVMRPVKATAIAPTVARILRIRSPNAALESALPEIY